MKKQIIVIGGGWVFDTYENYVSFLSSYEITKESFSKKNWIYSLDSLLPDFDVLIPEMPNKNNARYSEWKIWFDKILAISNQEIVLIGRSLGGIFLMKYLSENKITKNILAFHCVGAPFDAEGAQESLGDFVLYEPLSGVFDQVENIFMYFSKDDPITPFQNIDKFKQELPNAHYLVFEDRGHFQSLEFPEIVENIKLIV